MIREYAVELRSALSALGCPIPVVDDHDGTATTTYARSRIVVTEDIDQRDEYGPPHGAQRNPRTYYAVTIPVRVSIYVQSTAKGAVPWEHRRLARRVASAVISTFYELAKARRNQLSRISGGFVVPEDLEGSERPRGAVYELTFGLEAAVHAPATWESAAAPEFSLANEDAFASTTIVVDNPNTPEGSASTGCGA